MKELNGIKITISWAKECRTEQLDILEVHKKAPLLDLYADMGWLNMKYHYYQSSLQFYNRMIKMNEYQLAKKV